jgi:hypothetical protein
MINEGIVKEFDLRIKHLRDKSNPLSILLFVKKDNGEGTDFYFIGQVEPKEDSFNQVTMKDKNGNDVPVVKIEYVLKKPVEDHLYTYLTNKRYPPSCSTNQRAVL